MNIAETTKPNALLNFGFSGARMVVAFAGGLIASVIIARTLGAEEMGIYSFITWIAFAVASFASLGLSMAISRYVAEYAGTSRHALGVKIARTIIAAQVLAAVVISVAAGGVWTALDRHHLLFILLALAAVAPAALQQTLLALMEGVQRFDLQVLAALGGALLQVSIVGAFAWRHASIPGFLVANLFSSVAVTGLTLLLCRPMLVSDSVSAGQDHFADVFKRIYTFSLSIYALWFLSLIVFDKSELFFLRLLRSPQELAFYSIAFALTARMVTVSDSISNVLFPMFITRYTQNGQDGLRDVYRRSLRYVEVLMVPLYLWAIPLAPRLLLLVYGAQYARVAAVLQVLLATMLFTVPAPVCMVALFTMEKQTSYIRILLLVAVLNIVLDFLLIPRFGAVGAALANGVSQALASSRPILVLRKVLPGGFPVLASLKIYLAGAVSAIPVLYVSLMQRNGFFQLGLSLAIAALLYAGLLLGLRAAEASELVALREGIMSLVTGKVT
jgi:O-antigen/teichoic acid export membrane protein